MTPAPSPALVQEKTRLAYAHWLDTFGVVEYGRFAKRVMPLFRSNVPLRAFQRAADAYRRENAERAIALEWFLGDFQRWRRAADACPLDEWPGYANAACITDPETYRTTYLAQLHAADLAAEPQEPPARDAAPLQPSLSL